LDFEQKDGSIPSWVTIKIFFTIYRTFCRHFAFIRVEPIRTRRRDVAMTVDPGRLLNTEEITLLQTDPSVGQNSQLVPARVRKAAATRKQKAAATSPAVALMGAGTGEEV
jgi:hypothetical protein